MKVSSFGAHLFLSCSAQGAWWTQHQVGKSVQEGAGSTREPTGNTTPRLIEVNGFVNPNPLHDRQRSYVWNSVHVNPCFGKLVRNSQQSLPVKRESNPMFCPSLPTSLWTFHSAPSAFLKRHRKVPFLMRYKRDAGSEVCVDAWSSLWAAVDVDVGVPEG